METIKQIVGVDVAQEELVCTFGIISSDLGEQIKSTTIFENNSNGYGKFKKWCKTIAVEGVILQIVMEATGVYHEKFAYWLHDNKYNISIVLPSKISSYIQAINLKTITDKSASIAICKFGMRHKLDYWEPSDPIYKKMKQLTRERSQILEEKKRINNQLHAEKKEAESNKRSIKRMETRSALLDKQEKEITKELKDLIKSEESISARVEIITSIPGVAMLTAGTLLAETNGFEMVRNKRQLASYAGLDIVEKQSGTSIRKKTKISKKGNKYLRKALYFPAIASVRCSPHFKEVYNRLYDQSGIKMKGYVAVQRKILELAYILDKKQEFFDINIKSKEKTPQNVESLESSLC